MAYEYIYNNEQYGYDDEEQSISNFSSFSRKELEELKKNDKNFYQLRRQRTVMAKDKKTHEEYKKKVSTNIGVFTSGGVGSPIRNAITGIKNFEHHIGSKDEYLYFSVLICTGETGPDPISLFFDSPEQAERHLLTKIDEKIKTNWKQRYFAELYLQKDKPTIQSKNRQLVTIVK